MPVQAAAAELDISPAGEFAKSWRRWVSHLTLALTTILHAFTHAYGTMLVPLYLLIVADLHLGGVGAAALIITIYALVYALGSYAAGVLADRFDRRMLLTIGLIGNALAIIGIGLTRRYEMLIALGVVAGIFGTLFHPAANALAADHYPRSPGMAIGLLGMGAGLGFFAGPQYAGWRAETAHWQLAQIANWQKPCVELGAVGVIGAIVYLLIAREARHKHSPRHTIHPPLPRELRRRIISLAAILGWRDFAGIATPSLLSIYLQRAAGYSVKHAGFVIGSMMLLSILVNPLAVYFSPGRRRLPALAGVLIAGGLVILIVPLLATEFVLPVMCMFQALCLGSYAISDAATLERVDPALRGRFVGLFLTLAGTMSALAPWSMGFWSDQLKSRATSSIAYLPIFATLSLMMIVAAFAIRIIAKLGAPQGPRIEPVSETDPTAAEVLV